MNCNKIAVPTQVINAPFSVSRKKIKIICKNIQLWQVFLFPGFRQSAQLGRVGVKNDGDCFFFLSIAIHLFFCNMLRRIFLQKKNFFGNNIWQSVATAGLQLHSLSRWIQGQRCMLVLLILHKVPIINDPKHMAKNGCTHSDCHPNYYSMKSWKSGC